MRTIAITNQKGGVGKTTTAIALAHGLAQQGFTVCLIDLDAQGNVAACLGRKPEPNVYALLAERRPIGELCVPVRDNFWLLPGDPSTAELKARLITAPATVLRAALDDLAVDFAVIDTGPSRDLLHHLVYQAADEVIIPTTLDYLGLVGVAQQFDSLRTLRGSGRPLEVLAVLPTFWDGVTNESKTNLEALVASFGDLVTPAVPRTTRLREAPAQGKTPWEYLPQGHAALISYRYLVRRVLHL